MQQSRSSECRICRRRSAATVADQSDNAAVQIRNGAEMPFLRVAYLAVFGASGISAAAQAHCSASNLSVCPSPPFNAARANTARETASAATAAPDDAGSLPTLGPRLGLSP